MNLRNFRIGWRLLLKEPGYSGAVVCGLAVGFAACFLLLGFVRYCYTYNEAIADSSQIFVVKERRNFLPRPDWGASAPPPLRDIAVKSGPGVTATSAKSFDLAARIDQRVVPLTLQVADANFLDFFGIKAIAGDARAALARPDALVLSRAMALKLFGQADALGKRLQIDGATFEVHAILPDMPANTSVNFDAMVGAGAHSWNPPDTRAGFEWSSRASIYVKGTAQVNAVGLAALLQEAVARERDDKLPLAWRSAAKGRPVTEIALTRLSEFYFDSDLLGGRNGANYGNKTGVAGLAALAVLILLLASANYVNLATVRTLGRQREIGIRKVLGVSGARLAGQFIAESLVVSMLATLAGLLLAWIALPLFATLVNRTLSGMFTAGNCAAMLLLGALVGLLSALYPAWLALRQPVGASIQGRGNSETAHGMAVRRALSVFQFAAAICLIAMTLAVSWQTRHASQADPGFDAAPLLVLNLPEKRPPASTQAFRAELARLTGVSGVAAMSEAVGRDGNKLTFLVNRPGQAPVSLEGKFVGPEFFKVYQVKPLAGRLFDPALDGADSMSVVLNARAAIALGYASPEAAVGQMYDLERRIVGIAPDLRYQTLRQAPEPLAYSVNPDQDLLTVRVSGPVAAVRPQIEALWARHFPNDLLALDPAAGVFAQNYSEDARLSRILASASVVATALASFGIYVLSAYSVKRRSREIVLRKLYGAAGRDISRLMAREFGVLVGIGALAGLPLAWLATERYLAGFQERASMGAWPLLFAFGCVAVVALAATMRHTLTAVRMSPALALRE
jgi:putative ABC transport system permease protein